MVFPEGESTATINIEPIIDGTVEGIEEIVIEVASVTCDGLTNTISLFIDDEPLQVSVEGNSPVCPGDLTMLFAEITGGVPPYTYASSDGAVVNEHELVFTTSENVTVTVTDACGAQVEGGIIIDVPVPASMVVDLGEDQMLQCAGDITLTPAVSDGLGAYTYEWTVDGSAVADGGNYTFNVSADTEVTLSISDGCASTVQDEILLSVVQHPAVVWSGDDRAICLGETANLVVEVQGGYGDLSITWPHNGDSSWETSAAPGASTNFEFVITAECGTNTTGSIYVEVSLIEAGFTYTQLGTNTIAFESLSINMLTHQWDFGHGSTSEEESPTHEYESLFDFTAVTLTVENDAGCRASVTEVIPPYMTAYVPNAFTPNNDGVNDILEFVLVGVESFEFRVFNRKGEQIFQTNTLGEFWDGSVNGGEYFSPDGMYTWILEIQSISADAERLTGIVTMLRKGIA